MAIQKHSNQFEKLVQLDLILCRKLNSLCRSSAVGAFFKLVSRLGDGVFWYSLGIALIYLYPEKGLALAITYFASGIIGVIIYKKLKSTWVRERPFITCSQVFRAHPPLDRFSFPSGHTLHAIGFTTIVLINAPEWSALLIPFALCVALSRMVLGLHYPSDVLVGAALGFLIALACQITIYETLTANQVTGYASLFIEPMPLNRR